MALPSSGISDLNYPQGWPSPPSPGNPEVDASWYYYSSELALRRIGNTILNLLYKTGQLAWNNFDVSAMVRKANTFEMFLTQWHESLPPDIRYNEADLTDIPTQELAFMTRARAFEVRSDLYRPFLYYAIHNPYDHLHQAELQPFVEKAIRYCFAMIHGESVLHRHHGTWYACRGSVSASLMILGAVRSGHVTVPSDWMTFIERAIATLKHWEAEAPDIRRARTIVEELLLNHSHSLG
jgi:hypothetical protein